MQPDPASLINERRLFVTSASHRREQLLIDIISKAFSFLTTIPWKDFWSAVSKLLAQQRIVLALVVSLMVGGVFCVLTYWNRESRLESILNDSLSASLEETPQQHKGLEAFLMTSLNQQVRNFTWQANDGPPQGLADLVRQATVSPAFVDRYNQLVTKLGTVDATKCGDPKLVEAHGESADIVLTDDDPNTPGFLFAPLRLFRPTLTTNNPKAVLNAIKEDPYLEKDMCVLSEAATAIHAFTDISVIDKGSMSVLASEFIDVTPRQTYFITRSGLNRIFLRSSKSAREYYATQFRATTFFPSRPYFWPAFEADYVVTSTSQPLAVTPRVGSFFSVTQPYMDLGGNGIVITLSKGFRVNNITESALCFDLAFEADAGLQSSLKQTVDRFDGGLTEVTCHLDNGNSNCDPNHPGRAETQNESDLREALSKALRSAVRAGEQDKVFGTILVLQPLRASKRSNSVVASIPVGRVDVAGPRKSADFVVVEFDFFKYRRVTTIWALVAGACIFLAVTVIGFTLTRTILQSRDFENALHRITFVMEEAPTPFVWLDREDRVSAANSAFWGLIGRSPAEKFTLRSILADESLATYDSVQKDRETGVAVTPYDVAIKRPDSAEVRVRIRSMDVPTLQRQRSKLPETFGVFLDMKVATPEGAV